MQEGQRRPLRGLDESLWLPLGHPLQRFSLSYEDF